MGQQLYKNTISNSTIFPPPMSLLQAHQMETYYPVTPSWDHYVQLLALPTSPQIIKPVITNQVTKKTAGIVVHGLLGYPSAARPGTQSTSSLRPRRLVVYHNITVLSLLPQPACLDLVLSTARWRSCPFGSEFLRALLSRLCKIRVCLALIPPHVLFSCCEWGWWGRSWWWWVVMVVKRARSRMMEVDAFSSFRRLPFVQWLLFGN